MATVKNAVNNVMDAVVSTATTAANIINTVGKTVQMGSNYMDAALAKQTITLTADAVTFKNTISKVKALELKQIYDQIEAKVGTDPESQKRYNECLSEIESAIAAKLGKS